jgi:guanylate kinase
MSENNTSSGRAKKQALLVLFCGPSGSGKTSIVHNLLRSFPQLCFSVSATTRKKRSSEKHGHDYYFISLSQFREKINRQEFLEWEEVYPGGLYGTLKSEVQRIYDLGKVAIFDVDVEGGLNIKRQFGSNLLDVFVMPPGIEELKKRLVARATETDESLMARILRAEMELQYASRFSHVIVNHRLDEATEQARQMVFRFLTENNVEVRQSF